MSFRALVIALLLPASADSFRIGHRPPVPATGIVGGLLGVSIAAFGHVGSAGAAAHTAALSTASFLDDMNAFGYVMIPVALMVASQQYEVDHALDIIGGGAPPNLKPAGCYPLEYECEACELSQEFSSFYGEDIWLCSS